MEEWVLGLSVVFHIMLALGYAMSFGPDSLQAGTEAEIIVIFEQTTGPES